MKTTISNRKDTRETLSGEWNLEKNELLTRSYHEMADQPVIESDIFTDFQANIALLEELNARMTFIMKEVRYVLKA